jgi:hypothetical protein
MISNAVLVVIPPGLVGNITVDALVNRENWRMYVYNKLCMYIFILYVTICNYTV